MRIISTPARSERPVACASKESAPLEQAGAPALAAIAGTPFSFPVFPAALRVVANSTTTPLMRAPKPEGAASQTAPPGELGGDRSDLQIPRLSLVKRLISFPSLLGRPACRRAFRALARV